MNDIVLKRIFILATIIGFLYVIHLLSPVVIPFLAAFLIAYLFSPIVATMQKRGLSRPFSTTLVFFSILVIVGLVVWFIMPIVWKQLVYVYEKVPEMIKWVNKHAIPWMSKNFNIELSRINLDKLSDDALKYVQTHYTVYSLQDILLRVAQSGLGVIQIGGTFILVPIIAFYFLLDWDRMLAQAQHLIPRPLEAKTVAIVQECHQVLGAFVKGQFLVMILLGLVYAVGLQLIGLETGIIIGVVAGLASIIPYLGFAVGIITAIIASFFQFGLDWTQLLLVGVVFMVGQAVEGYILQPFLLGDKIGLSPVAVVFAVLAGAQLMGFVGMLIALPVAAVLVVFLRHFKESYEHSQFYGAQVTVANTQNDNIDIQIDQPVVQNPEHTPVQNTPEISITVNQTQPSDAEQNENSK
ncbi:MULTISPECIES: AI-2E family transporter [unclassified Acinetobacter]|uniref:AI-2E family transporter n=1 Tax=unclassified Acinetobacter TaxID=196816 RepID=UPI0035B84EE7